MQRRSALIVVPYSDWAQILTQYTKRIKDASIQKTQKRFSSRRICLISCMIMHNFLQSSPVLIYFLFTKRYILKVDPLPPCQNLMMESQRNRGNPSNCISMCYIFQIFSKSITIFTSGSHYFRMIILWWKM